MAWDQAFVWTNDVQNLYFSVVSPEVSDLIRWGMLMHICIRAPGHGHH